MARTKIWDLLGPQGVPGPQGLPGVNAVANDTATAGYVSSLTSLTRAAVDAAVWRPTHSKERVILFGTSLEAQNGTGADGLDPAAPGVISEGWFNWMNSYCGNRFYLVRNAGVGGNTYAQMLARIAADVMAYPSDYVFMGGPTNDISGGFTAAAIIANLDAMLTIFINAGRKVHLLNAPPSTSYDTSGKKAVCDTVNAYIANLNGKRGVTVTDVFTLNGVAGNYGPRTGMTYDANVHYSEMGAHRIGRQAAADFAAAYPSLMRGVQFPMDHKSVISNAVFRGGTGWSTSTGGGAGTVTATYTPGRAILDLSGFLIALPLANPNISYVENISGGKFTVGDIIQSTVRIRWSGLVPLAVSAPCRPYLSLGMRLNAGAGGGFADTQNALNVASAHWTQPTEVPESGEMILRTPRVTVDANVDRLYTYLGFEGAASVVCEFTELDVSKVA